MRPDPAFVPAAAGAASSSRAATPAPVPLARAIVVRTLTTRALAVAAVLATGLDFAPVPPNHASSAPGAEVDAGAAYRAASARPASATRDRSDSGASTTQSAPYLRISITSS